MGAWASKAVRHQAKGLSLRERRNERLGDSDDAIGRPLSVLVLPHLPMVLRQLQIGVWEGRVTYV